MTNPSPSWPEVIKPAQTYFHLIGILIFIFHGYLQMYERLIPVREPQTNATSIQSVSDLGILSSYSAYFHLCSGLQQFVWSLKYNPPAC